MSEPPEHVADRVVVAISGQPLDPAGLIDQVAGPDNGGIGVFVGVVRSSPAADDNADRRVVSLQYEAYLPVAERRMFEIASEAADKWALGRVAVVHRTGKCALGEPTVVVACSAPHRAEALDACRFIIDELKVRVPIWKKEIYKDGSAWVGS